MRHKLVIGTLFCVFLTFFYLFHLIYTDAKKNTIAELNSRQLILAKQAQAGIENYFINVTQFLSNVSQSVNVADNNDQMKNELNFALSISPEAVKAISRVDLSGRIIYTAPYDSAAIAKNISNQKHIRKIMKTHKPVISDVFTAVQGYRAIALHVPVFKNNAFSGTLGILIDFLMISERFLQEIRVGETGYAWMTSREGIELYCPVPGHSEKSVFENCKDFPTVLSMADKMIKGEQGVTTYQYDRIKHEQRQIIKKDAVYLPIRILDSFWSIVVASSENEALESLAGFKNTILLIVGLFLLAMLFFSYFGMKTWGMARHITELRQAEQALKKSEERYRDIFNNLMDVYFTTTVEGFIENVSPSAETVLGYPVPELLGKKATMLYQNPQDRIRLLNELQKKGQVRGFELLFKRKNGEASTISVNADLNYDENGKPLGLSGTIRDITQQKRAEKEKRIARKIAAEHGKYALVGQIAGKMAHDFNNILAAIMGNTELALLNCPDAKIEKRLDLIFNQSLRGKNLTRNLVAFAKDQEPKQEYFRVNDKIELVLNLLQKELEKIDVIREYTSSLPNLLADPGMIEHALVNLIQNSVHATSRVEQPEIVLRTYEQDQSITIEIEDNGCGIPGKFQEKIFEPGFTLKGSQDKTGAYKPGIKGTGYGMANVKKYIDQHKGSISIISTAGKGTTTVINFPVIKKELTDNEIAEIRQENLSFEKYILLVEDEQAISDVQYHILTTAPCNHKVDIATNGQVAMDLFNRNRYDLVSLDYLLPGEINGMDVYHHIRKSDKGIPILFVSGNLEFLESIKALQQKDFHIDHLSKPCRNLDYLKRINGMMDPDIS